MENLESQLEAITGQKQELSRQLASTVADATEKANEIATLRQLTEELKTAMQEAETPEAKRRGAAKAAERGVELCRQLRRKDATLEDLVDDAEGPSVGISDKSLENLVRRHVEAVFRDGHANPRRTRALIQGIMQYKSVARFLDKDAVDEQQTH